MQELKNVAHCLVRPLVDYKWCIHKKRKNIAEFLPNYNADIF